MTGEQPRGFEIGIFTFGEIAADPATGRPIDPAVRLREFIDLARLADQAGLDVFGVGEHHRPDFAISSPPVVLAAVAQATERIRLTSTVTVLSTADPVKVFEDFSTVDLISDGRAEITAGRGAYTESFPLFGYDLADYDELFDEKLGLLLEVNGVERVTWSGRHRARLTDAGVYPRPVQDRLPVWIAVGGTPASVVRAGRHGLPLYLAILGQPARFAPLADLYWQTGADAGHDAAALRVGVTSHFYVEETSQGARDTFYPYYSRYIGANMPGARGQRLPRDAFDAWAGPDGALFAGSPQEVIDKILWEHETPRSRPVPRPDRTRRPPLRRDRPVDRDPRRGPAGPPARNRARARTAGRSVTAIPSGASTVTAGSGCRTARACERHPGGRHATARRRCTMRVTIVGAGNMGRGIGTRLVAGGNEVELVDQNPEDSRTLAEELGEGATSNRGATGEVVVLALPYEAVAGALAEHQEGIAGRIVIDIVNPVDWSTMETVTTPAGTSAAEETAKLVPEGTKVVKAFNTTFAKTLVAGEVAGQKLQVLIAGDDEQAKKTVASLVEAGGMTAVDVGPLRRSRMLEQVGLFHIGIQQQLGTGFASALSLRWDAP